VNRSRLWIVLALLFLTACAPEEPMRTVIQVSDARQSGSIPPELQWVEQTIIRAGEVRFTRGGRVENSQVNAGEWSLTAPPEEIARLLTSLSAVDPRALRRIEPQDPPDGGGARSIVITYADGSTLSLDFDPGVEYAGAEPILQALGDFVGYLEWPQDALAQIRP